MIENIKEANRTNALTSEKKKKTKKKNILAIYGD